MKIVAGARLTITNPTKALLREMKKKLTLPNPEYRAIVRHSPTAGKFTQVPPVLKFYSHNRKKKRLVVPRGALKVDSYGQVVIEDCAESVKILGNELVVAFPEVQWELTSAQKKCVRAVKRRRDGIGNFLMVLPTSAGKTVAAAACAAELGQRTLVIVNTETIHKTAWIPDLVGMFGISEEDIGVWKQRRFLVGEHFTIGSLQTIQRRLDEGKDYFGQFGTVIFDEVHIVPAPLARRVLHHCHCRFRIGITATLRRRDGLHLLTRATFGDPVLRVASSKVPTATSIPISAVKARRTEVTEDDFEENVPDFNAYLDVVTNHAKRNKQIAKDVARCVRKKHSCLVVTHRIAHVEKLRDAIEDYTGNESVLVLVGGTKDIEAKLEPVTKQDTRVIVATLQYIKTGTSITVLDRLFLATSIKARADVEQVVGRIRRADPNNPKKRAIVYDYVDSKIPWIFNHYKRHRAGVYKKMKVPGYENMVML